MALFSDSIKVSRTTCPTAFAPYLFICCLFISSIVHAQQTINDVMDSTLIIHRDVRLDSLVMRHIRVNEVKDGFDGYRLQLFSGTGTNARQEANALRATFMEHHPHIPAYLIYQTPNFKVRVGDFRTELEAIHLQRELSYQYPGAFVVRDEIAFPKLAIELAREMEDEMQEDDEPQEEQSQQD